MGQDARATLTVEGQTFEGTAHLEHKELVFRGDTRFVIPLASIRTAVARDGVLRVTFGRQSASLAIGAAAEKWAKRITNPPSRLDKLGVKEGMRVALVSIDVKGFADELKQRGAVVSTGVPAASRVADIIFYGIENRDGLGELEALSTRIAPAGAIWIVRPKGSKAITESETMAAGKKAGLVDVKVVSFSDTHTAEKFVIPVAHRPRSK